MKRLFSAALFCLFAVVLFTQLYCSHKKPSEPVYASLDSTVTYVGMQECKGCHMDIYNSYVKTGMGLSIDHAVKEKSAARFSDHPQVYDKYSDFYYKPFWNNDSLYFLEFRLEGSDTVHKRLETVSYIIGSGQHTNSHIYSSNGYLFQAPLTFYTQKGEWDLPPGFENGNNTRFNRIIGLECLSCHNGFPHIEQGSENRFISVPNGIDCERCHGPGSRHVAEKKAGKLVDVSKEIDYSIVNPAKLPVDLQLDVCQRCHIQGNAVLNDGKSFYDFKPGMRLSDVMNVFMPLYRNNEDEHIMASHAERLKESACFINSSMQSEGKKPGLKPYDNAITCITCHDPHVSRLETPVSIFNDACNNCHGKPTECKEDMQILKTENFNCVKCHMPVNNTTDIPHVSVHDHKIRIPVSENEKRKVKEFIGIAAINNPNPDDRTKARAFINYFEKFGYGAEMLDSALKLLPSKTSADKRKNIAELVHVYFLSRNYARVVETVESVDDSQVILNRKSLSNNDAWSCYRIGDAYKRMDQPVKAEMWFAQSYRLAPLDPQFANEYAEQLAVNGKINEATALLNKIISLQPRFAPAYSNLGYIYMSGGDFGMAEKLYDQALALDPDYEAALLNKAGLLLLKENKKGAVLLLKRVLKKNPGNSRAAMAMKQIEGS